jgi:cobalamin biosynthesis Co2+ chelatase CbiK
MVKLVYDKMPMRGTMFCARQHVPRDQASSKAESWKTAARFDELGWHTDPWKAGLRH